MQMNPMCEELRGCFLRAHSAVTINVSFSSSYASLPYSSLDNLDRANYDYLFMASNSGTNTVNVAYDQTGTGLHLSVSPANFTGSTDIQIYAIGIHK